MRIVFRRVPYHVSCQDRQAMPLGMGLLDRAGRFGRSNAPDNNIVNL